MFLTSIVFILTLSILILIHELGHFLAAKKAGIKVEEFGLGYPPRILAKKIGETVYSLNWIFFGGFVRLYGEELSQAEKKEVKKSKRAFWAKSKKARTGVILAGVTANFLLGVLIFSSIYSFMGIPTKTDRVTIGGVAPGTPADQVGLKEGDLALSLDGEAIKGLEVFVEKIEQKSGQEVQLAVEREGEEIVFLLTPRKEPPEGEGPLGILVSDVEMKKYPFWQMPFRGAVEGLKETYIWTKLIVDSLGGMLASLIIEGSMPKDIAGPIGIFQATGIVAQKGLTNIIRFIGILSINLAIVNILPLPVLDGGRMVFVLYEAVTRRRPKPKIEQWANMAGLAMILALMVLVTFNDIDRIVDLSNLWLQLKSNLWRQK